MNINKLFRKFDYIGHEGNRSNSDDGHYVASVKKAVSNYSAFRKFKRDPRYQAILEHASKEQGDKCLEIIRSESPYLLDVIETFKINDLVGGATTYEFDGIGSISPSTLRYLKVASDLKNIFGEEIGDRVAEIGCGYGGQLLIADKILRFKQYDLFDLPPVLSLASMYLESHILNFSYKTTTLNQHQGDVNYDLVISNYAFSELPSQLQIRYIEKILSRSKRGYLTMNTGKTEASRDQNKLTLEDLRGYLPEFEVLNEVPLTSPNNYLIVWGRNPF
jgi:putative sugar O-methyltransferase